MTSLRTKAGDTAVFAVTLAVNLALLYWPHVHAPGGVPHLDKAAHVASFAAVAWAGCRLDFPRLWLGPLLIVHAVASEIVQQVLLPQRSGDPFDAAADVIGVGLGLIGGTWSHERARDRRGAGRPPLGGEPGAG